MTRLEAWIMIGLQVLLWGAWIVILFLAVLGGIWTVTGISGIQ